jgi:hypothetical protein
LQVGEAERNVGEERSVDTPCHEPENLRYRAEVRAVKDRRDPDVSGIPIIARAGKAIDN